MKLLIIETLNRLTEHSLHITKSIVWLIQIDRCVILVKVQIERTQKLIVNKTYINT